jgi:tRNA A37 threonylcarbamoyladenosine biosynthesis protein TsaE
MRAYVHTNISTYAIITAYVHISYIHTYMHTDIYSVRHKADIRKLNLSIIQYIDGGGVAGNIQPVGIVI